MWASTSRTTNPDNLSSLIDDTADAIAKQVCALAAREPRAAGRWAAGAALCIVPPAGNLRRRRHSNPGMPGHHEHCSGRPRAVGG